MVALCLAYLPCPSVSETTLRTRPHDACPPVSRALENASLVVQGEAEAMSDADWEGLLSENGRGKAAPEMAAGPSSRPAGAHAAAAPSAPPPGFEDTVRAGAPSPKASPKASVSAPVVRRTLSMSGPTPHNE